MHRTALLVAWLAALATNGGAQARDSSEAVAREASNDETAKIESSILYPPAAIVAQLPPQLPPQPPLPPPPAMPPPASDPPKDKLVEIVDRLIGVVTQIDARLSFVEQELAAAKARLPALETPAQPGGAP